MSMAVVTSCSTLGTNRTTRTLLPLLKTGLRGLLFLRISPPTDQYRSWRIRDLRFGFLLGCDPATPVEQWSWQRCRGSWRKAERGTAAAPTATVTLPQRMYYSFVSFP